MNYLHHIQWLLTECFQCSLHNFSKLEQNHIVRGLIVGASKLQLLFVTVAFGIGLMCQIYDMLSILVCHIQLNLPDIQCFNFVNNIFFNLQFFHVYFLIQYNTIQYNNVLIAVVNTCTQMYSDPPHVQQSLVLQIIVSTSLVNISCI